MSGTMRLCYQKGLMSVETVEVCKLATKKLEKDFKDSRSNKGYPKGCYFLHDTQKSYFNTHKTGSESRNAEQICKLQGNNYILAF